ncbi:MAG: DUF2461 domain-containing protein [Planctomycetota bacterium]|nr:DUF2461 domain-containing protein [Planctomycetota bacterium]
MTWLRGLAHHNEREWFKARRVVFESAVKTPTLALAAALTPRLAKVAPAYAPADPARALHRIYRDVRFTTDKTPYHTSMGLGFGRAGVRKGQGAGFWVYVSATGVEIQGGALIEGGLGLELLRSHIATHFRAMERILRRPTLRRVLGVPQGPRTQRIPSAFERDHPAGDWLCFRGLHLVGHLPAPMLTTRSLPAEIMRHVRLMLPFVDFLHAALEPS